MQIHRLLSCWVYGARGYLIYFDVACGLLSLDQKMRRSSAQPGVPQNQNRDFQSFAGEPPPPPVPARTPVRQLGSHLG